MAAMRGILAVGVGVAAGTVAYSVYSGKGLAEIMEDVMQAAGVKESEVLQPGSMAVSATPIQGVPSLHLGEGKKEEGLYERRLSYKYKPQPVITEIDGIAITDDVALPGSLAVTGAQLDGASPTLALGRNMFDSEDKGTISPASIFVRRTSSKKLNQQHHLILDEHPTMAVSASQLGGKSPDVVLPPVVSGETSLFERRKLRQNSDKQLISPTQPLELDHQVSMAVSASLLEDGGTPVVKLGGGMGNTVFARRQESAKKLVPDAKSDKGEEEKPSASKVRIQEDAGVAAKAGDGVKARPVPAKRGASAKVLSLAITDDKETEVKLGGDAAGGSLLTRRLTHKKLDEASDELHPGDTISPPKSGGSGGMTIEDLSMAYTLMTESPTMKLEPTPTGAKANLFARRMHGPKPESSKGQEGGVSPVTAQVRSHGSHFKVGAIRSEYAVLEERLEKAQQSLAAREADFEASDKSLPQGADQARAWHAKQVADALAAKLDIESQLGECWKRLSEAQRALQEGGGK